MGSAASDEWDWAFSPRADDQFASLETGVQERIVSKLDVVVSSEWREPAAFLEPLTGSPFQKLRVGDYRLGCRLSSSAFDWVALVLLGYPAHVTAEDHGTGFRILGRAGDRPRHLSMTAVVWDTLVGAAVASVGLLVLLSFGGLFVLDALGVGSFTVGRPDTVTFVFAYVNTPEEISISVGLWIPVVGGLIGLVYSFVRSVRRRGKPHGTDGRSTGESAP